MGCYYLLQGIFLTQGLNSCLLHWPVDSLPWSYLGSLYIYLSISISMCPGLGRYPGEGIGYQLQYSWASLVAQMVKNSPEIQTWVQSLVWEDPMEEGPTPAKASAYGQSSLGSTMFQTLGVTALPGLSHPSIPLHAEV